MTSKFEIIRKLRALEASPYPEEAEAAKRKADALESEIEYEEWMLDLSDILHKNFPEKNAGELLNLLIEQYYRDGYVGNYGYQEYFKEGVSHYCKEYYYSKYEPIHNDDIFETTLTEDENICQTASLNAMELVSEYLEKNGLKEEN